MAVEWTITIEGRNEFGDICRREVRMDKSWERLFDGDLGLSIEDGKKIMVALQNAMVSPEAETYSLFRRVCPDCHTYQLSEVIAFAAQFSESDVKAWPAGPSKTAPRSARGQSANSKADVDRRAEELDAIAAVLPIERRDELAELLTDQDIETLRHLVSEGMGDNTLRALTSDLAYLQAWSLAATRAPLPWPRRKRCR